MSHDRAILVGRPPVESITNCTVQTSTWAVQPTAGCEKEAWVRAVDHVRIALPGDHTLVFNPLSDVNVVVLDASAGAVMDTFSQPRPLANPSDAGGLAPSEFAAIAGRLRDLQFLQPPGWTPNGQTRPHALAVWLHLTNSCNLRCTYCYIDKTGQAMDEETGRAAVEAVFRSAGRNGFQTVKLKYAGGEATLHFGLLMKLHEQAASLMQSTGIGLQEAMLSNGVALSKPMIDYMTGEDIRLMISLDGIGAAHDAQRLFANGRGSSRQVERAIDRAIALGLPPDLSITVTAANAEHLAAVVGFALERDLRFNLNFYRRTGTATSAGDLRAEDERIIAGVRAAFAVIEERLPRRRLIDSLLDRSAFNQPHEFACGAGRSLIVIDQAGGVARCQMEMERPLANVFVDDPLEVIQLHNAGFQSIPVGEKEGCKECSWRFWCAGGCPLLTYRTTGRSDIKSPYCNVYKALFPDLLRLEGLRLLKWGSD